MSTDIKEISSHFKFEGDFEKAETFGCGHINHTYAVYFVRKDGSKVRYILQKINTSIFNPEKLMHNIALVTDYMRGVISERGGDVERETLTIIKTIDEKLFYEDSDGDCWRSYVFIENTIAYQIIESSDMFRDSGYAFGDYAKSLSGFPADKLYEIIPNFHNTVSRLEALKAAVKADKKGRAAGVKEEIDFCLSREKDCGLVVGLLESHELPLRVTHNDTKLNNILIDEATNKALCIVDLDTIMPGSILYDFGDSIRSGATTAAEDETDLSKVNFDINLFESYANGYLEAMGDAMTEKEKELLAFSGKLLTLECGMRFLTDYLDGDNYFHIDRENHNLDRARNQFKLVADMERVMPEMERIVREV